MSDPRNTAHQKKVQHDKAHRPQAETAKDKADAAVAEPELESVKIEHGKADLEKSVAVLSKLKEMEFHSRANIETLAGLTLTVGDELKQKEFADPIGELYSVQDGFQSRIAEVITTYSAMCEELKAT